MSTAEPPVPADFPLNTIGPGVDRIALPEGPFQPAGAWRHQYGVYSTAARPSRVGQLRLERVVRPGGRVLLQMEYQKSHTGGTQRISARIHPAADHPLSAPGDWSFHARLLDGQGRVIEHTPIKKSVVFQDGTLVIQESCGVKKVAITGDYTLGWALFDAVGRLPAEQAPPLRFTLIDHFDQVKPGHVLSFRTAADVTIRDRTLRLHAFDQVGTGVVPWVWWVDRQGCLLAAVSGLESYLLESSAA